MSAPPTERSTPIKPEDIPGAVRVFPMPMMSSAASGSHWKHRDGRSASVDMNGYGGGSLAGPNAARRHSPITLPRATKNFRSQTSHHTQCVELKLRWRFYVHASTWPEFYFLAKF